MAPAALPLAQAVVAQFDKQAIRGIRNPLTLS